MRALIALARDRRGSSAVEFVGMFGLLTAILFVAADLALAYQQRLQLEQAAGRTAELVTAPGTVALSYANLTNEVRAAYGKPVKSATVTSWLECDGTANGSFTGTCGAAQQTARYVTIQIKADFVPLFDFGGVIDGGKRVLTGDATVRVQ